MEDRANPNWIFPIQSLVHVIGVARSRLWLRRHALAAVARREFELVTDLRRAIAALERSERERVFVRQPADVQERPGGGE